MPTQRPNDTFRGTVWTWPTAIIIQKSWYPRTKSQLPTVNARCVTCTNKSPVGFAFPPLEFPPATDYQGPEDPLARRTGHSRNYQLICLPLIRYVLFKRCPDLDFHLFGCKTLLERWRITTLKNDLLREFRVFQRDRKSWNWIFFEHFREWRNICFEFYCILTSLFASILLSLNKLILIKRKE